MKPFLLIFGIGILVSFIYGMIDGRLNALALGSGGFWTGLLYLLIGLVLLIPKDKKLAGPFMLSGLFIFLIGVTSWFVGFSI